MNSPEPEFYVVSAIPYSIIDDFCVVAVFTKEDDAVEHVKILRESTNYRFVCEPHKEMMSTVLERLLVDKLSLIKSSEIKEITLKF